MKKYSDNLSFEITNDEEAEEAINEAIRLLQSARVFPVPERSQKLFEAKGLITDVFDYYVQI